MEKALDEESRDLNHDAHPAAKYLRDYEQVNVDPEPQFLFLLIGKVGFHVFPGFFLL